MPQPEDVQAGYEQELAAADQRGDKEHAAAIRKAMNGESSFAGVDFVSSSDKDTEINLPQPGGGTKRVKQATVVEPAAVRNTMAPRPNTGSREE